MSRPLRIQYPGAWYHVMNRGRRSENIFYDDKDRNTFLDLLQETSGLWNIRISAYCLMPNHYHILVQTPDANISRSMRHINGVYTQRFNSRHECDGQLFRGRYKSILVGGDSYLLQLVRYTHRNPVRAGIVSKLNDYKWSSHKGYLSVAKKWNWLHKEFIFSILDRSKKNWIRTYRKFVAIEEENDIAAVVEAKRWPSMLGPEDFCDWMKGKYYTRKNHEEIPEAKILAPGPGSIIKTVCAFYDVEDDELFISKRSEFNEPRNVAVFLFRTLRHDSLKEIARQFCMEKYSTVSSIIQRLKRKMNQDRKLKKRVENVTDLVCKGQGQT